MQARNPNSMESFQDGGQQNMKSEQHEYPAMDGSRLNPEMNSFPHTSGDSAMGPDNFPKSSDGMHPNAMQNYPGYNRGNYGIGDQHGGTMADYNNQNSQFSGQFSQTPVRSPYSGVPKSSMASVRPGMMPPGIGMMPGSYSTSQRMMSTNQNGPTPTLNQLLQTSSSGQRYPGNYSDFSGTPGKAGEMNSGSSSYPVPHGWNGNPRALGPYPQGSIPGSPYRHQGSSMGDSRRPSGMSPGPGPGYPHQGQFMGSAMAANSQRPMMGQVRPTHMPPMSGHGYNQQMPPHSQVNYSPSMPNQTSQPPNQQQQQQQQQMFHGQQQQPQPPGQPPPMASPTPSQQQQQQTSASTSGSSSHQPLSPKQASPAVTGLADQSSDHENSQVEEGKVENSGSEISTAGGGSQSHLGVAGLRPVPSPAGSTGSRSDTPASNSGTQVGSPMPPRPPSSQLDSQGRTSQSPMATQGYSQQMMPPPMAGQMGYPGAGAGGKMGAGPGMAGGQMPPHYPQYNSQYPQGNYRGQQTMGPMQGGPGGTGAMPGSGSYPQPMYNGPGQMGPASASMYNNMMGRSMQSYNAPYGPGTNMPMNSHYGGFNSHMAPGQGPGPGPGPGPGTVPSSAQSASGPMPPGPGQMMGGQMGMGQPGMGMQPGSHMMPGAKGAQAAAQAALMAAASSAGTRMPGRGMAGSPRMMGPQGGGSPSPGSMNHMVGNLGNPSLNSISNQIQQITSSSVTVPSKPSSPAGGAPQAPIPSNGPPSAMDKSTSSNSIGVPLSNSNGGEAPNLMSPMSGSDTQESSSRPSSTTTPGQTADAANSTSDIAGSDGSSSMPSSDSTSVDSGFHSTADHSEKPPSESTPTFSSSPSNSNPPPSTNGQYEDRVGQESDGGKVAVSSAASSVPTSVHSSNTTTTVTSALGTAVMQSITASAAGEMSNSSSQTTSSMPMMMSSGTAANSTSNGPHYPHPHPNMNYPVGPHGSGPMPNSHMMPGPGMQHPGMQHGMGNMPPYNIPPGNMPPGGMPAGMNMMPAGGMPNNMPPGGMMNSMPHGGVPSSMAPGNVPPRGMPNNMMRPGMPNHMPPGSVPGSMPQGGSVGTSTNSHPMGPANIPPQTTPAPVSAAVPPEEPPEKKKKEEGVMVGAGPSFCEDYENSSSPGWPGMPKASDITKLYDMGNEMDRRPFLERLFGFMDEKGKPIATMPTISKNPLDLYKLYHCVREKGGFIEVNKAKRWKEICTVVNIGSSASAAFTLKKNYIRYLFDYECKFDLGGLDPTPILKEMESQGDRKRDSKKRVPSPGSQSSQDAFQQAPTPNSQMMDGYHGGPPMPPPYMQGPDGQMMPPGMGGPGMMMPNNMIGHPNMMSSHPGSGSGMMGGGMGHGPNSMMMSSGMPSGGPGPNMMGGNIGPQSGMMNAGNPMMGPGGMMGPGMHGYGSGAPNSMMGSGPNSSSSSLGPSPGPPSMAGSSSSGTNTVASSSTNSTATSTNSMMTPASTSMPLPPSSTPNSRPPTADSVSIQDPFADEPGKASSPATFQSRSGPPAPSPTPGGFPSPGPPTTSSTGGFGSRPSSASNPSIPSFHGGQGGEQGPGGYRRTPEGFQPSPGGPFPGRVESAQFPFSQENSSQPSQPFRPPSGGSDPGYSARFPGQQPQFRPGVPGEGFSSSHPFPSHGPGMGPRMPGQEGFSSFPSPQHPGVRPSTRDGSYSGSGGLMSQSWEWNGAGVMGHMTYSPFVDALSDCSMSAGRESGQWSPMHSQRSFPPSAPGTPPMGPYGRTPQRASPQTRDKVIASKLQVDQSKACGVMPATPFPPKKEIVFPSDCVESAQPTLTKRRRLTHKDLGAVEAWRLMMALKSGLLAESTWAIDTLNILLFDDATVTYFNLSTLPGLLEVLTEHFRSSLIHIFRILNDQELKGKASLLHRHVDSLKECGVESGAEDDGTNGELEGLMEAGSEARLDKAVYAPDYTNVTRQGKAVVKDQACVDRAVLDRKAWDSASNFSSGHKHWQRGGGDITQHVVPCMESSVTHQLLTDLFYNHRTSRKETAGGGCRKRKAACDPDHVHNSDSSAECQEQHVKCSKQCQGEAEGTCEEKRVSGDSGDHSSACGQVKSSVSKVEVKQELQDSELHRAESDDSLPPPLLPDATQDSANEENIPGGTDCGKEESDDKPAPPELTREEDENNGDRVTTGKDETEQKETKEKMDTDDALEEEDDDSMTAEIVAMMMKEQDSEMEEEAYRHDDAPLTTIQSDQEEMGRRCVAISNIFRSLSCIPGNEALLSKHQGLVLAMGRVLLLHHWHPQRPKVQSAAALPDQEGDKLEETKMETTESDPSKEEVEEGSRDWATSPEWWWDTLEAVRENALVVLANICSHMHMRDLASEVCMPILDGLLHWMVCPSSSACDPLPSAPSTSQLSPQRLVLEALCKLCIHDDNVDLLLATPPFSRILLLMGRLVRLLSERSQPVPREFSIVLLSRLVQGDPAVSRAIALQHPSISLLIEFLESAEQSALAVISQQGVCAPLNSPDVLGTSLDMLCRAASILLHVARVPENRKFFLHHQSRLLALVMSQTLDSCVTQIVSDVLFECSQSDASLPT